MMFTHPAHKITIDPHPPRDLLYPPDARLQNKNLKTRLEKVTVYNLEEKMADNQVNDCNIGSKSNSRISPVLKLKEAITFFSVTTTSFFELCVGVSKYANRGFPTY